MNAGDWDGLIGANEAKAPIPIRMVRPDDLDAALNDLGPAARNAAGLNRFTAKRGQMLILSPAGKAKSDACVLFGLGADPDPMAARALPALLPPGDYRFEGEAGPEAALAFALGGYRFDRYKQDRGGPHPRLVVEGERAEIDRIAHAAALCRDMVNTPANDMGPLQIETITRAIAEAHGGEMTVVVGDALLEASYPAVHAVGRAAVEARAPRMIEIAWRGSGARDDAPLLALVGKGVVFDTGGLDIKPSAGMRQMKKDMGGAAHALALARLVMGADLPVRLAVLVPAVENAISGDAMRPGDVLDSRSGLTIEVGNTDAEGRLILADALTRASELEPDLTIDLATLTGAARVALGPQVIPFYTADDALAAATAEAALNTADPLWRMPLWAGYDSALDSDVADLKNDPDAWAQAGSVTAALFLQRFAPKSGAWLHLDIFAWNPKARPGRPAGGEAQAIFALYAMLKARYRR